MYRVCRSFQRHDGSAMQSYRTGQRLTDADVAGIPPATMHRLLKSGSIIKVA